MHTRQTNSVFPILSYVIGVALGLFLVLVGTWADMEAASYGFPRLAEAGLDGLNCPILMTRTDATTITLTVRNPTDDRLSPSIRTLISTAGLPEEFVENLVLAPGESKKLAWQVDAENIDLGNFIFAKVLRYSAYPVKSRETTCGIFVLDVPGSGKVILATLAVLSFLGMGWGLYALSRLKDPSLMVMKHSRAMLFLTITLAVGFAFNLFSMWMPALLTLTVVVLMLVVLLAPLLLSERRDR